MHRFNGWMDAFLVNECMSQFVSGGVGGGGTDLSLGLVYDRAELRAKCFL